MQENRIGKMDAGEGVGALNRRQSAAAQLMNDFVYYYYLRTRCAYECEYDYEYEYACLLRTLYL